jgi:curved DNA-binding protein CbpA
MGNIVNYYHILGVSHHATFNEIKEAYRQKVKAYHPDKETGNAELFKRIKEAYEILGNSEKRKVYDDLLFTNSNNTKPHPNATTPSNTTSNTTVITLRGRSRKKVFLSSLTINAAIILIGMLVKKK